MTDEQEKILIQAVEQLAAIAAHIDTRVVPQTKRAERLLDELREAFPQLNKVEV